MAEPQRTHDVDQIYTSVDGVRITGWGETPVAWESATENFTDSVGADGSVTVARSRDERLYVTLSVQANSLGAQYLDEVRRTQLTAEGEVARVPFMYSDGITGTQIRSEHTVFLDSPGASITGSEPGTLEYRLLLPAARQDVVIAADVA